MTRKLLTLGHRQPLAGKKRLVEVNMHIMCAQAHLSNKCTTSPCLHGEVQNVVTPKKTRECSFKKPVCHQKATICINSIAHLKATVVRLFFKEQSGGVQHSCLLERD
eukprot:282501-Pelagomonas_calceolata.AAC.1